MQVVLQFDKLWDWTKGNLVMSVERDCVLSRAAVFRTCVHPCLRASKDNHALASVTYISLLNQASLRHLLYIGIQR